MNWKIPTSIIALAPIVLAVMTTSAQAQTISGAPSIASYHSLGRCLDVRASDNAVLLWNCHGGGNQAFRFVSGNYGMISLGNQQCLTAPNARGGALTAQTCTNATNQRWGFQGRDATLRVETGFCADIEGGSNANGARIIGWDCAGSSNQRWYPAVTGRTAYVGIAAAATLNGQSGRSFLSSGGYSGGNIVASGGGTIVAGGAGNIVAGGAGNIVAGGAGNIIAAQGGSIVAGGAGNIVAGGAGNFTPSNWNFFSGAGAGSFRQ